MFKTVLNAALHAGKRLEISAEMHPAVRDVLRGAYFVIFVPVSVQLMVKVFSLLLFWSTVPPSGDFWLITDMLLI